MSVQEQYELRADDSHIHPFKDLRLCPRLAEQWQFYTFQQFLDAVPWKRLGGLDREAWTACMSEHKYKNFDMTEKEAAVLKANTPFAINLRERREELKAPLLPAFWDLPKILKDLQDDEHPQAVEVYLRMSRGVWILPPETAAKMQPTKVENYKPKTAQLLRQRKPEIARHYEKGYIATWASLKAKYGELIGEPVNIHAIGTQPKNDEVCRITVDGTNAGDKGEQSVNDASITPTCIYPRYVHMCVAMTKYGCGLRADATDAFLLHKTRPESLKHVCGIDPDTGEIIAFTSMPLGFVVSAAVQQDTMVAQIRTLQRRLRKLGLPTGTDPQYQQQWPMNKPKAGHSLTACLGYCDDIGGQTTSWPAGWFVQIQLAQLLRRWGIPQSFKHQKSDGPDPLTLWIGYLFACRQMQAALHAERIVKMKVQLQPFMLPPAEANTDVEGARSLIGTLNFATNIMLLGKALMAEIRAIEVALNRAAPHGKASSKTPFACSPEAQHQCIMWYGLLDTMPTRSAVVQIRRRTFPYPGTSDASFDMPPLPGWCWACFGRLQHGCWPQYWVDLVGTRSDLAAIFITEMEIYAIVLQARSIFPHCKGMRFEGYSDNLGAVFMMNKLSSRSRLCRKLVEEILWLAVAYDIEIAFRHVPTEQNCLTDSGTRQADSDFAGHEEAFRKVHTQQWCDDAEERFPAREPARPEVLQAVPTVNFEDFLTDIDDAPGIIAEWQRLGLVRTESNRLRALKMLQVQKTQSF